MAKKKKLTHSDFMFWLQGLEDALGEDWTPNADQWKRIRAKLENVVPDVKEKVVEVEAEAAPGTNAAGQVAQFVPPPAGWTPPPQPAPAGMVPQQYQPMQPGPEPIEFEPDVQNTDQQPGQGAPDQNGIVRDGQTLNPHEGGSGEFV